MRRGKGHHRFEHLAVAHVAVPVVGPADGDAINHDCLITSFRPRRASLPLRERVASAEAIARASRVRGPVRKIFHEADPSPASHSLGTLSRKGRGN